MWEWMPLPRGPQLELAARGSLRIEDLGWALQLWRAARLAPQLSSRRRLS